MAVLQGVGMIEFRCCIVGCKNPHQARGFCTKHYQQSRAGKFGNKVHRGNEQKSKIRLSEKDKKKVAGMYADGLNANDIAYSFNISLGTVYNIAKEYC